MHRVSEAGTPASCNASGCFSRQVPGGTVVWLELHAMDAERNTPASLRSASTARLSVPGSEKFTMKGDPPSREFTMTSA